MEKLSDNFSFQILDVKDPHNCRNVKVYIADAVAPGLVVYDHQRQKAWRVENRYVSSKD